LVAVTRAECLFFDSESGALWSEAGGSEPSTERRAVVGLLGYVARTRMRLNVPAVAADPRWIATLDGGQGGERLLAIPIVGQSLQVHAVLVAWRAAGCPPFARDDEMRLSVFARRAAPLFDQLSLELQATEAASGEKGPRLFRTEVLESRLPQRYGSLLRMPRESTWVYVVLAGLLGLAVGFIGMGAAVRDEAHGGCAHYWFRTISEYVCKLTVGSVRRRSQPWRTEPAVASPAMAGSALKPSRCRGRL
jgi:hypothetical protein